MDENVPISCLVRTECEEIGRVRRDVCWHSIAICVMGERGSSWRLYTLYSRACVCQLASHMCALITVNYIKWFCVATVRRRSHSIQFKILFRMEIGTNCVRFALSRAPAIHSISFYFDSTHCLSKMQATLTNQSDENEYYIFNEEQTRRRTYLAFVRRGVENSFR